MLDINCIKSYCLSLPSSREDYPFGPAPLVIKVGSKMYALIIESNSKINISLKCDPILSHSFRNLYDWVKPGYHLNKEHWNTLIVDESVPKKEVLFMINHSYELVCQKLTKSERKKLHLC